MRGRVTIAAALVASSVICVGGPAASQSPSPPGMVSPDPSSAPDASGSPLGSPVAAVGDPRCDPFLTADVVAAATGHAVESVDFFDNGGVVAPLIHVTCTWHTRVPLRDIDLQVSDLRFSKGDPPFLITKYEGGTPVPDLGQRAYSMVENGSDLVAWEVRFGQTERTFLLYGYGNPIEALVSLARHISADAQPGPAPGTPLSSAPGSPGVATSALIGTWLLATVGAVPVEQDSPPVTIALRSDGTARIDVACKPAKKSKAPRLTVPYSATATTIALEPGGYKGACRSDHDTTYLDGIAFALGVTFGTQGTWSLVGDTLTVTGGMGPVTFQRVPAP